MAKRILVFFGFLIIVLFAAAIAIPMIFKAPILKKVKSVINEKVNARVDFKDLSLSVFKNFPSLSLSIENTTIIGTDTFSKDTLANISDFTLEVGLWEVIKGDKISIKSVQINGAKFFAHVLKNGKANWDISKPDTSTIAASADSSNFIIALQKYTITNSEIIYTDESLVFFMHLKGFNHSGNGDFTKDDFVLETNSESESVDVIYEGIKYLSKAKLSARVPFNMNLPRFEFNFMPNEIHLNNLLLSCEGRFAMPGDDFDMDLKFDAAKSNFENFISLIPGIYQSNIKDVKANGKFAFNGFVKGIYNDNKIPAFGMDLLIENGSIQSPDLPQGIKDLQVKLSIKNPDGNLDHTISNLMKFHLVFAGESLDANLLSMTPISDPFIAGQFKGTVDIEKMLKLFPIENTKASGKINADFKLEGNLSSLESGNYYGFKAAGIVALKNINYETLGQPKISAINSMIYLSPKNIDLNYLNLKIGSSDIAASGSLQNYLLYYFKNQKITGKLNVNSSVLDLNELMPKSASAQNSSPDTTKMEALELPKNIQFILNSSIGKILYEKNTIEKLVGKITLEDGKLIFNNISFTTLGAFFKMDGTFYAQSKNDNKVEINFSGKNINIPETFKAFNTIQKIAPIGEKTKGFTDISMGFSSKLNRDLSPDLNSLAGSGNLYIQNASIENFTPFNKLADAIKLEKYKKLNLKNTKIGFKFSEGKIIIDPFDIREGNYNINVSGYNKFDQSIDYVAKLSFPQSEMGSGATQIISGINSKLGMGGVDLSLPSTINVNALITGTVSKPIVKLSMGDMKNEIKNTINAIIDNTKKIAEEKIKEELGKVKADVKAKADQILANAQKEADLIIQNSNKLADQAKNEGYAAAAKLENEASNPISKIAAKKAGEKIRQESDNKSNKIKEEGKKRAQQLLDKAKTESDNLLK